MSAIVLKNTVFEDIRSSIKTSKDKLTANKQLRKELIQNIRSVKADIKAGENLCSKLETSQIDGSYVREVLKTKRIMLLKIRQELLLHELMRDVELARFRALHSSLDKLKVPVDPEAFNKKHGVS